MKEENVLIALFMGAEFTTHMDFCYFKLPINKGYGYNDLKYHTSWDWLMPVVEKIENFAGVAIIKNGCKMEFIDHEIITGGDSTIEATYTAVIAFIKYYNEKK